MLTAHIPLPEVSGGWILGTTEAPDERWTLWIRPYVAASQRALDSFETKEVADAAMWEMNERIRVHRELTC